jgi:calcineurin-like phosphoesterase family protein
MVYIKKLFKYGYMEIEGDPEDIWFVADLHMFHANIIRLCNRPFGSVEVMSTALVVNWNSVVKKNDIVFNLGDFCWSKSPVIWSNLINKLNGHQVLIKGNHDHPRTLQGLSEKYRLIESHSSDKLEITKTDKLFLIREKLELRYNDERYLLDHYPQVHYAGQYYGMKQLFGHTHEKPFEYTKNHYNVCVERNEYQPVSLKEIKNIFKNRIIENAETVVATNLE